LSNNKKNELTKQKRIVVSLEKKQLCLIDTDGTTLKKYPVIYGRNSGLGTKEAEGDQRTPRGSYYVCTINEESQFRLFFGLSYPSDIDAVKGYAKSMINIEELKEVFLAQRFKKRPPWNTKLGGEIGIHGGGIDRDGTRGCIAMKDEDIIELGKSVFLGMNIDII
jgi:murein L,D-transpeptidase YafK